MNKKINKAFFLVLAFVPFVVTGSNSAYLHSKNALYEKTMEKNTNNTNNVNNDPDVDYETSGGHIWGSIHQKLKILPVETETRKGIQIQDTSIVEVILKDSVDREEYSKTFNNIWVTIYDVTDGQKTEKISRQLFNTLDESGKMDWWDSFYDYLNIINVNFKETDNTFFSAKEIGLEEFHNYQLGFNVNKGDDFIAYSNVISFSKPEVLSLEISKTIDSITVVWSLSKNIIFEDKTNITVEYQKITASLNGEDFVIGDSSNGKYTFEGLENATNYNLTLGYEATKNIGSYHSPIIAKESLIVATEMPSDYSGIVKNTFLFFIILLIILLLILLLLFLMFLYSNKQRKKITELALVVNEDNQYENHTNHYDNDIDNYYHDNKEGK